ncbi:MAG: hypothetical protein QM757_01800 [Paludibaculum sp.]
MSQPEGPTYLSDGSAGLLVEKHPETDLHAGDVVDVAGVPRPGEFSPLMGYAELRLIRSSQPPVPLHVTADQALEDAHDLQLVELDGFLVDRVVTQVDQTLVMQSGRVLFPAKLASAPCCRPWNGAACCGCAASARSMPTEAMT